MSETGGSFGISHRMLEIVSVAQAIAINSMVRMVHPLQLH